MKRRNATLALTVLLTLSALCAQAYAAEHVRHHCTGAGCTVCVRLEACLHRLSSAAVKTGAAAIAYALAAVCAARTTARPAKRTTPVTLRVVLLD